MIKKIIIVTTLIMAAAAAYATVRTMASADHDHSEFGEQSHSGRTDKNGGHYDRSTGTYHYH